MIIRWKLMYNKFSNVALILYFCLEINNINNNFLRGGFMNYKKPEILAQSTTQMAECRPNSKPSGRPCNPPKPGGR